MSRHASLHLKFEGICSVESKNDCLAACASVQGCHCALYDASSNQCSLKWAPCNSVILNLQKSDYDDGGETALQPCMDYPVTVKPKTASTHLLCGLITAVAISVVAETARLSRCLHAAALCLST